MVTGGAADVGTIVFATIVSVTGVAANVGTIVAGVDADVGTDVLGTIVSVVAILSHRLVSTSLTFLVISFFSQG